MPDMLLAMTVLQGPRKRWNGMLAVKVGNGAIVDDLGVRRCEAMGSEVPRPREWISCRRQCNLDSRGLCSFMCVSTVNPMAKNTHTHPAPNSQAPYDWDAPAPRFMSAGWLGGPSGPSEKTCSSWDFVHQPSRGVLQNIRRAQRFRRAWCACSKSPLATFDTCFRHAPAGYLYPPAGSAHGAQDPKT